jgi:hypothetical protein
VKGNELGMKQEGCCFVGGGWGLHERNIGEVRDSRVGKEARNSGM